MARSKIYIVFLLLIAVIASWSCRHKSFATPLVSNNQPQSSGDTDVCFDKDILPIFTSKCAMSGCHGMGSSEGDYVLDNYTNIISKGINPGNASASKIYKVLLYEPEDRMPRNAPPLSDAEKLLIKRWIDAGAKQDTNCSAPCDSNNFTFNNAVKPLINKYCIGCHSGTALSGNVVLLTYTDVKNAVLNRNLLNSIRYEPGYSGMPKGGVHLSACEIRQIEKWVEANMPNN